MLFFAVQQADTLAKVERVPPDVWLKLGLGIAIFILILYVLRKAAKMNKVLLTVLVLVVGSVLFFSWIYNRNEPKFLTPVINKIAPWFPSKGAFDDKQNS